MSRRTGMTLVEIIVAVSIFSIVAYALTLAVRVADKSSETVFDQAARNRELRSATSEMAEELKGISEDHLSVEKLENGCTQLTFQLPIVVDDVPAWGVEDAGIGRTADSRVQEGWSVRYTVEDFPGGNAGDVDRGLVRQLVDDEGIVRFERLLVSGLWTGNNDHAFAVTKVGAVWEIEVSIEDGTVQGDVRTSKFSIRTRNE